MTAMANRPPLSTRGGVLYMEDCALPELARQFGTPLYVYSRSAMLDALASYQRALTGRPHLICYAMKANSNLAVLRLFAEAGCGFDIVSGGELERVLAAGGDPARVVFSGVGKTRREMERALSVGVKCFNVESDGELDLLSSVAMRLGVVAPVSLRVNPDVDARTHPYISTGLRGNKFGIAHDAAVACYRRAASLPGLKVIGIDCHIGSQIVEADPYLDALDRLLDLVEAVESDGIVIEHMDLGGGLGIAYADENPPTAEALVGALLGRIEARGHSHRTVLLEPGRSLVGPAGVLLTEVLYLKPASSHSGGADEKNFCVVDAGMNDLMRPAMYQAWMPIVPCTPRDDVSPVSWDVVGPVCESSDWLGRDRSLAIAPGDLLAVLSAGAYGMSMASNYNSRGKPAELMIDKACAQVIRERETVHSLFESEQ